MTITNKSQKRRSVDSFVFGIIVVTALVLAGVVYIGAKMGTTAQVATDAKARLTIDSNIYDWGAISIDGGIISKSFAIQNTGSISLKLYDVQTSCMCTTAQLKTSSKISKKFGMHEKTASVFEVQPGETAELLVEFDPAFHGPSGIGPISRTITMNTNDQSNPKLTFQLSANVVKQ